MNIIVVLTLPYLTLPYLTLPGRRELFDSVFGSYLAEDSLLMEVVKAGESLAKEEKLNKYIYL